MSPSIGNLVWKPISTLVFVFITNSDANLRFSCVNKLIKVLLSFYFMKSVFGTKNNYNCMNFLNLGFRFELILLKKKKNVNTIHPHLHHIRI
jgi:hypothetical protein